MRGHVAEAAVAVAAPIERVWSALTDPELVARYLMGAVVASDWLPGSAITWSGEYRGRSYVDNGEVLEVDAPRRLVHTHFSPLSGAPEAPESYHTLVWSLREVAGGTEVTLSQDNNGSPEEAERNRQNWTGVLQGLKAAVEA